MGRSSLLGTEPAELQPDALAGGSSEDDLAQVDRAGVPDTEVDEEEEDESADPVGDGHSDAEAARKLPDWPSGRGSRRRH